MPKPVRPHRNNIDEIVQDPEANGQAKTQKSKENEAPVMQFSGVEIGDNWQ